MARRFAVELLQVYVGLQSADKLDKQRLISRGTGSRPSVAIGCIARPRGRRSSRASPSLTAADRRNVGIEVRRAILRRALLAWLGREYLGSAEVRVCLIED